METVACEATCAQLYAGLSKVQKMPLTKEIDFESKNNTKRAEIHQSGPHQSIQHRKMVPRHVCHHRNSFILGGEGGLRKSPKVRKIGNFADQK